MMENEARIHGTSEAHQHDLLKLSGLGAVQFTFSAQT